jgi:hypothetical protein
MQRWHRDIDLVAGDALDPVLARDLHVSILVEDVDDDPDIGQRETHRILVEIRVDDGVAELPRLAKEVELPGPASDDQDAFLAW